MKIKQCIIKINGSQANIIMIEISEFLLEIPELSDVSLRPIATVLKNDAV